MFCVACRSTCFRCCISGDRVVEFQVGLPGSDCAFLVIVEVVVSAYDFLREAESYKLTLEEEIYNKVFCACIKVEHPDGCLYLAQALETRFKRVHDEEPICGS